MLPKKAPRLGRSHGRLRCESGAGGSVRGGELTDEKDPNIGAGKKTSGKENGCSPVKRSQ